VKLLPTGLLASLIPTISKSVTCRVPTILLVFGTVKIFELIFEQFGEYRYSHVCFSG
jgi:hypothetical protein